MKQITPVINSTVSFNVHKFLKERITHPETIYKVYVTMYLEGRVNRIAANIKLPISQSVRHETSN